MSSSTVLFCLHAVCLAEVEQHAAAVVAAVALELASHGSDPYHPGLDPQGIGDRWAIEQDRLLWHMVRLPERDHPVTDPGSLLARATDEPDRRNVLVRA